MSVPVVTTDDKNDIVNFFDVFFEKIKAHLVDKDADEIKMVDLKRVYFHFAKTCKKVESVLCKFAKSAGCSECQIYDICQDGEDTIHKKECELVSLIFLSIQAKKIIDIAEIKTRATAVYALKTAALAFGENNL